MEIEAHRLIARVEPYRRMPTRKIIFQPDTGHNQVKEMNELHDDELKRDRLEARRRPPAPRP